MLVKNRLRTLKKMTKQTEAPKRSLRFKLFRKPFTIDDLIYILNVTHKEDPREKSVYIYGNAIYSNIGGVSDLPPFWKIFGASQGYSVTFPCLAYEISATAHLTDPSTYKSENVGRILVKEIPRSQMKGNETEPILKIVREIGETAEKRFNQAGIETDSYIHWEGPVLF